MPPTPTLLLHPRRSGLRRIRFNPLSMVLAMALVRLALVVPAACAHGAAAQASAPAGSAPSATPAPDDSDGGPNIDNGPIVIPKKKQPDEPPPPPAPAQPTIKNPGGATYSLRVDVPIVNLDVSVILDKNHQFVPGLKPANFLVLEDGVEQKVDTVRLGKTPITAVMLLEFAANSWYFINDMQNAAVSFFQSLRPDDYVAVMTYDLQTHILSDFTNNQAVIAQSLNSLTMPTFTDTNLFDALYETLDRTSRIEGRKYVLLIGTGRDTFSKITYDRILAKVKATPDVTIFSIGTGALVNEMGAGGGMREMNYLQAQNQLRTFAAMTGGLSFFPLFPGELPDDFTQINDSIRNQYILTYRPSNTVNDGSYRKIKVILIDNEGHPLQMQDEKGRPLKYSVIARDGYNAKRPVE